jgi:phosphatidylglycerophosphate synthase
MSVAADACTLLRIVLAPLFAWVVARNAAAGSVLPFAICVVAVASDFADGRLARAGGRTSEARRIFDHGADILFLLPGLIVLAHAGRVPRLLPWAAGIAFALYAADGVRRGDGHRIDLAPSRSGAAAGVANYVVVLLATAGLWLDIDVLGGVAHGAGVAAAALNAAAAIERVQTLASPRRLDSRV